MSQVPKALLEESRKCEYSKGTETIDLSMAENWLIRNEVIEICKGVIKKEFSVHHMSWPKGFWGDPALLEVLASFFNTYFKPQIPVFSSHLAVAPGAAGCLDALLYNICDPGDGVLVPAPYWNGNDVFFRIRSAVTPVPVNVKDLQQIFSPSFIHALNDAFCRSSYSIKALILANPHNPLGRCYPKDILEACLIFCRDKNIHFISDEVFALSTFSCPDEPDATPFVSVLALDLVALGCSANRVHAVWSMSKDFGSSGIKLGCTITQANDALRNGLALAAHMNVSTLSTVFAVGLLSSSRLPELVNLNSARLARAYTMLTQLFKSYGFRYFPCSASPVVIAQLAPQAQSWDEEATVVERLKQAGVMVGCGKRYHMPEKGWVRICFAVEEHILQEAIKRMEDVFGPTKSRH